MQLAVRITLSPDSPVPDYTGGPFVAGVALMETANPPLNDGKTEYLKACSAFGETVDIATGGNYGQLSEATVSVSNHDKWYADMRASGAFLTGAKVEIGEAGWSTRWAGTVADDPFEGVNIEIRVEGVVGARHKLIPVRCLSGVEFPGLSPDNEGKPVPVVYGDVMDMTPPSLLSTPQKYAATLAYSGPTNFTEWARTDCISATAVSAKIKYAIFLDDLPDIVDISPWGMPPSLWINGTTFDALTGAALAPVYIEIVDGTGSGQKRIIIGVSKKGEEHVVYATGRTIKAITEFIIGSEWDTFPDSTSVFVFSVVLEGAKLVFSDDGVASRVHCLVSNIDSKIAFSQKQESALQIVDISSEFFSGEDYSSLEYVAPKENFGVHQLTDGISISGPNSVWIHPYFSSHRIADTFCNIRISFEEFPIEAIDTSDIYALFSFSSIVPANQMRVVCFGELFDGTSDIISQSDTFSPSTLNDVNAYSSSMISDGTGGNFSRFAYKLKLNRPLSSYQTIRAGLYITEQTTDYASLLSGVPLDSAMTEIVLRGNVGWDAPQIGEIIQPYGVTDYTFQENTYSNTLFCRDKYVIYPNSTIGQLGFYGLPYKGYRRVIGRVKIGGSGYDEYKITIDAPFDIPAVAYDAVKYDIMWYDDATHFYQREITEREAGFAFVFGAIPQDSQFRVDISSGRTYSASWPTLPVGITLGDPITLARDAILDMFFRDLGFAYDMVDFASFQALPADPIHSALVERVNSADRVAQLCQQFNWVIGHDETGRETAQAWLRRVGSASFDITVDTGDVVEGSFRGVALSDILDLVNLPNAQWDWTQADGYRQQSNVIDIKVDPLLLNASNYMQYLTGFGDAATALDVYCSMHASYKNNLYQRAAALEFHDAGSDISGLLWPSIGMDRFTWMASRKPIYQFEAYDGATAASTCTIGQRIKLRHKRYTAGAWAYGTLVAWSMDPLAATVAMTVMGDPSALGTSSTLLVDTIDPTGEVSMLVDQIDGTSTQTIDTIGLI